MRRALLAARPYLLSFALLAGLTLLLAPVKGTGEITAVSLLFLLATLLIASRSSYPVALVSAAVANQFVNFFFVPPLHRLAVSRPADVAELAMFLAVAFIGAFMLARLRDEARTAREHEADAAVVTQATRAVATASSPRQAIERLGEVIARASGARGSALLAGEEFAIAGSTIDPISTRTPSRTETAMALEAAKTGEISAMPGPKAIDRLTFLPLSDTRRAVLRLVGQPSMAKLHGPVMETLRNDMLTALDRLELAERAERAVALERAGEFKSILLSGAAHDLRTPLTAIKAAVTSLLDDAVEWGEDDSLAFLETIDSQTDRLTRTVSNLLEMSRIESGAADVRIEMIEVGPLLEEVVMSTAAATREREVVYSSKPGIWVRGDYGLLSQSLINLVENAAAYSHPGGPIRLEAAATPGRVVIKVVDSGPGLAAADLVRVWERHYRAKTARQASGLGLGLALVKGMIERLGGTVSAASEGGQTTFAISLPAGARPR